MYPATGSTVPLGMPGHAPEVGLPYDPERGRWLLAEAGFHKRRHFPSIEGLAARWTNLTPIFKHMAAAGADNLGVQATWAQLRWGELLDRLYGPEPPQLAMMGWMADYADPDNFPRVAEWRRRTGWRNQAYDELLTAAERSTDQEQRITLHQQADRLVVEEAVVVPIAYGRGQRLVKPWVRMAPSALYQQFWRDYIIEPH
jgi:ABC-type transport system substrate-binding protein